MSSARRMHWFPEQPLPDGRARTACGLVSEWGWQDEQFMRCHPSARCCRCEGIFWGRHAEVELATILHPDQRELPL